MNKVSYCPVVLVNHGKVPPGETGRENPTRKSSSRFSPIPTRLMTSEHSFKTTGQNPVAHSSVTISEKCVL